MTLELKRELEALLLALLAGAPLYLTAVVSPVAVAIYQLALAASCLSIYFRHRRIDVPPRLLHGAGILFLLFFPIDAAVLTRSLIGASIHLLFFIAGYQAFEKAWEQNALQRFLVSFLLFLTSLATSTHPSVLLFVILFTVLSFRQLMHLSRQQTSRDVALPLTAEAPTARAAAAYLIPTAIFAVMLFPLLPRLRSPVVRGFGAAMTGSSTGISDSLDFSQARSISLDPEVVARIWMPRDAVAVLAPLRLRAVVYDRFEDKRWVSARTVRREAIPARSGIFPIGRVEGFSRQITVQQRLSPDRQIYLPVGTQTVQGVSQLVRGPKSAAYVTFATSRGVVLYQAQVGTRAPQRDEREIPVGYVPAPEIAALARSVVGPARSIQSAAKRIEAHLTGNYTYFANPANLGGPMTVEDFLLRQKKGHCEYFAAGMVTLLSSVNIRARIVGGFYGGEFNPLTGYFLVRKRDGHAWVEVLENDRWVTYDPTPPALRPGNSKEGLLGVYAAAIGDSLNYFWDRYILTFGLGDQLDVFTGLIQGAVRLFSLARSAIEDLIRQLIFLPVLFAVVGAVLLLMRFRRRRSRNLLDELIAALRPSGLAIPPSMTAQELQAQLALFRPDLAHLSARVVDTYQQNLFGRTRIDDASARVALRQLREQIAKR